MLAWVSCRAETADRSGQALPLGLHYAPSENLETIDVAALATARTSIDMSAYELSDIAVEQALLTAAAHGVPVRLYIDARENARQAPDAATLFGQIFASPHIALKEKRAGAPIMHLKAYCVDGHLLRTGSANFSASGLMRQDNDLELFDDRAMCAQFTAKFERMWTSDQAE